MGGIERRAGEGLEKCFKEEKEKQNKTKNPPLNKEERAFVLVQTSWDSNLSNNNNNHWTIDRWMWVIRHDAIREHFTADVVTPTTKQLTNDKRLTRQKEQKSTKR